MGTPGLTLPRGRRLIADSVASLLDQGMLSLLNLAVGLLLIRLTTKDSYGLYAQLYVGGIFAATVLDAVVTGPLTTVASGLPPQERRAMVLRLAHYQRRLAAALALLCGTAAAAVVAWVGADVHPLVLGLTFAAYVYGAALREYARSVSFMEGRPLAVLRMDGWYTLAVAAGLGALAGFHVLTLPAVMLMLAVANLVALRRRDLWPAAPEDRAAYRAAVAEVWRRGRWSLPGAMVAWATNYSYLYLAALWLGATASADLNASRLLLMPISLCVLAWSRVARPHAVRLLAEQRHAELGRYTIASVIGVELLTFGYVGVLWLSLPWLEAHVLGAKYAGLEPLVLAWGGYFALNAARWIGSALLSSGNRYRMLLVSGVLCLVAMLAASAYAIPRWGVWGAVLALAVVEVLDLLLIWCILLPRARRDLRPESAS